jgi:hypothetical protein
MRYFLLCLLLLPVLAEAITPPPPVVPSLARLLYSWTVPPTRADGAPLAPTEVKEYRIYISSLESVISVPAPATSYVYIVPSGACVRAADGAAVTAVDTGNLESAASNVVQLSADACSGKSPPGKPGSAKVTVQ